MRPQAGVGKLKHAPPMQANDLPLVAQAVPPANYIFSHLLGERFPPLNRETPRRLSTRLLRLGPRRAVSWSYGGTRMMAGLLFRAILLPGLLIVLAASASDGVAARPPQAGAAAAITDRNSTRLNSNHFGISY